MTLLVGLAVLHIGIRLLFRTLKSVSMTPVLINGGRGLTPTLVKTRVIMFRQRIGSLVLNIRSLFARIPCFREEWVLEQKFRLIVGNCLLIGLLYIGTGLYIRVVA
jgi:hypothetical protein